MSQTVHERETPEQIQELLQQPDELLAVSALKRNIAEAQAKLESAQGSLRFTLGYSPSHPGPAPHQEAGGMDHEDWNVARLEYEQYDADEEIDYKADEVERAEERLYSLYDDKEHVDGGDSELVSKYAQDERERLQSRLEKQRSAERSAARYAVYERGAKIDGSSELESDVKTLVTNKALDDVHGEVSPTGWKFLGTTRDGNRFMFERLPKEAATEPKQAHYKYKPSELLTLQVSDGSMEIQYSQATDIDEEAVKHYGPKVATVDAYKFKIKAGGVIAEQNHTTGPMAKWLPNFMDNGSITPRAFGSYGTEEHPDAILDSEDLAKIQAKIAEVFAAMKELAE